MEIVAQGESKQIASRVYTRFVLPNGKEAVVFSGLDGQKVGWQRWLPSGEWQPFDPAILKFTPADKAEYWSQLQEEEGRLDRVEKDLAEVEKLLKEG